MESVDQHAAQSTVDFQRASRYLEWCRAYGLQPVPEALVAFRLRLRSLRVSKITSADLLPIAEMLRFDNVVTVLDCSGSAIGNSGCFVLAQRLFGGEREHDGVLALSLFELRLDYCGVEEAGAVALLRQIEHSNLRRLHMRGNRIGGGGSECLAKCLRRMRSLHYVDVSNNFLRRKGVQTITHALVQRAQARLERNARMSSGSGTGAHHAASANGADLHRQVPHVASGRGLGWLVGEASDVVVTYNSVVRTNWKRLANVLPGNAAIEAQTASSGGRKASGKRPRGNSGSGPESSPSKPTEEDDDELDVEVKISGNLVREEIFNSAVMAAGLLMSLLGAVPLLSHAREVDPSGRYFFGAALYLLGLIAFFASSTLNHSLFLSDSQHVFRLLDHSAVYALIAGTYSSFLLVNLHGTRLSSAGLIGVWSLALVGIAVSTTCPPEGVQRRLRLFLYGLMGWIGLIPYYLLHSCVSDAGWTLLAAGGVVFSAGVLVYVRERRLHGDGLLAIWYIFVIIAATIHFMAVYHHVQPATEECLAQAETYGLRSASEAVGASGSKAEGVFGFSGHGYVPQTGEEPLSSTLANAAAAVAADGKRAFVHSMSAILQQMMERLKALEQEEGGITATAAAMAARAGATVAAAAAADGGMANNGGEL
jgi:hemolysin III